MRRVLHFYLEGIALEANFVERNGFEHLAAIADKACRGVVDMKSGYETYILAGKIAHQDTSDRPVHNVYAADIA